MPKRTIVLIDGANLFYSLKDLKLLEKDIKWDVLFKYFLEPEDELIRTYWFRPQKLADGHFTGGGIRHQIVNKKYKNYAHDYYNDKSKVPANIISLIEQDAGIVETWLKDHRTRFSQIEYNYDQIGLEFGDIEFVKTGIVKINPYAQQYIGEKGVDIALAVKMISLSVQGNCDKIILVSGDYDYAEAIKFVKDRLTKIHVVKFHKGYPPTNKSVSRDLAVLADKIIDVYESEVRNSFLK